KNNGVFTVHKFWQKNQFMNANKNCGETLRLTSSKRGISHLTASVHQNICQALEQTRHLKGDYVEIGVMRGGSALTAANYMKLAKIDRHLHLLDTYDGFNYEEAKTSSDSHWNGTHGLWGVEKTMKHVENVVHSECPKQKLTLTEANICKDDLPKEVEKIVVANIDVDMYEATRDAMIKVAPKIVKGGIMICEDPTSTPGLIGAFYAMEKFLETDLGKKFMKLHLVGQYFLVKLEE
ncbi:MAG: TylF/MycF/NovP-related O-methyltransferase, partial [Flavobacteriales bacterium]